jgi:TolB-like protein
MRTISGVAAAMFLSALAGCYSGRLGTSASGAVLKAEQEAREAIQSEQALAGRPLTERVVGVPAFEAVVRDTSMSALGYGLADLLLTDLGRSQRLVVVERLRLDAITRELQLAQAGLVDDASAPRVGRLVQARYLVLGKVVELPNGQLQINTRVAEVPTADIGRPLSFSAPTVRVIEAERALALRLLEELGVAASPQLKAQLDSLPTLSFPALLAYSRGVRSMAMRDLKGAASNFENALSLDPTFGPARTRLDQIRTEIAGSVLIARAGRPLIGDLVIDQVSPLGPPSIIDRPGGPVDPAFPTTRAFLVVIVRGQ